jgi:hypothetical protein
MSTSLCGMRSLSLTRAHLEATCMVLNASNAVGRWGDTEGI